MSKSFSDLGINEELQQGLADIQISVQPRKLVSLKEVGKEMVCSLLLEMN